MRSIGTVVSAGVLLLVATACATSEPKIETGAGNGPELTTSAPAPVPPSEEIAPGEPPPNGGTPVPADKVDATALPEGSPHSVWTEGDGRTLGVIGQEGGCSKASLEVAEQSPTAVRVVLVETMPTKQEMCTMDIRFPPLTVNLDAPLAERPVVLTTRQQQK
jgi:hypothetical protein